MKSKLMIAPLPTLLDEKNIKTSAVDGFCGVDVVVVDVGVDVVAVAASE